MGDAGRDKEVTLNYIDKVYDMLVKTWSLSTKLTLALIITSLLMLTIAVGWVSAQQSFSLGGLSLRISLAVLLGSGAALIASLHVALYTVFVRSEALHEELLRLYGAIGYNDEEKLAMDDSLAGFGSGDLLWTLVAPYFSNKVHAADKLTRVYEGFITWFVLLITWALIPLVAEIATIVKLASVVGWQRFHVWSFFLIFVFIAAVTPLLWLRR